MMRTGRALIFAVICEMAGKTCTYANAICRRAQRLEYWAATHRDKCRAVQQLGEAQLNQPDMCH